MFEDFDDWQVHAVRAGIIQSTGFFPQTYPADAVTILAACIRRKFGCDEWPEWAFHCIARDTAGRPLRTLVYAIGEGGSAARLMESRGDTAAGSKAPFVIR